MRRRFVRLLPILLLMPFVLAGFVQLVRLLWNHLLPVLFGLPEVSFWQAAGLLLLSRILFGSSRWQVGRSPWRERMRERWESMTPEQRAAMRQRMGGRWGACGDFDAPGESAGGSAPPSAP